MVVDARLMHVYRMNASSFSWEHQVEHFGRSDKFSILVFDNRGVGNSGTPMGPYRCDFSMRIRRCSTYCVCRTSDMAQDTIALLDYIGWTAKRDLHVVGGSLGDCDISCSEQRCY